MVLGLLGPDLRLGHPGRGTGGAQLLPGIGTSGVGRVTAVKWSGCLGREPLRLAPEGQHPVGPGRLGVGQRLAAGVVLGQGGVHRLIRAGRNGEVRGGRQRPRSATRPASPRAVVLAGSVSMAAPGAAALDVQAVRLAPEGQPDVRRRVGPGPGPGRR